MVPDQARLVDLVESFDVVVRLQDVLDQVIQNLLLELLLPAPLPNEITKQRLFTTKSESPSSIKF